MKNLKNITWKLISDSGCGYSRNNYDLSLKAGSKVLAVRRFVTEYQCKIDCDETQGMH